MLEIGANLGICTTELLLRTRAHIIAIEPSPLNLWYLTRTLRSVVGRHPQLAGRVVVLPVAVGAGASNQTIFVERHNLGNTLVGSAYSDACRRQDARCLRQRMLALPTNVSVLPLDALFPRGLEALRMLKMDVQGYECEVLRGATLALARSPRLSAIATEVAPGWLNAHCCGRRYLIHQLRAVGRQRPAGQRWNVSCTNMHGRLDATCFARPPSVRRRDNLSVLATAGVLGAERRDAPLSSRALRKLTRSMQYCRRIRGVMTI